MRHLTNDMKGILGRGRLRICDRDRKWSRGVRKFIEREGVQIVQTPTATLYAPMSTTRIC